MQPFYHGFLWTADSVSIFNKIDSVRQLAIAHKDDDLLMEAHMMYVHYFFYRPNLGHELLAAKLDSLQQQAVEQKRLWAEILAENLKSFFNFDVLHNYEAAFVHKHRVYQLIKNISPADFPYKQACLTQTAHNYYVFRDYRECLFFNKEALAAEPSIRLEAYPTRLGILNTMGICYQQMNMPDSSDYYFQETYNLADKLNIPVWKGISSGNLGHNYFLRKAYDKAEPLLLYDVKEARAIADWGLASGSLMVLANISLIRKDFAKARQQIMEARGYVYRSGQYRRLKDLYPLLCKLYTAENQPGLAAVYLDSALFVTDSVTRQTNALLMLRAEQRAHKAQYDAEIAAVQNRRHINILQRNGLIGFVFLLLLVSLWVFREQTKKQQRQEEDIKRAEKELKMFARNIAEKNEIISLLREQFETDAHDTVEQLKQSTILTEEDWEYFCALFDKVHTGYLHRVKKKLPDLTPAEVRFVVLSRLQLSLQEMAAMLGINQPSVRKTRSRLKKKLDIDMEDDASLDKLVADI